MPSGYTPCPCRDCMEIAIDGDLCRLRLRNVSVDDVRYLFEPIDSPYRGRYAWTFVSDGASVQLREQNSALFVLANNSVSDVQIRRFAKWISAKIDALYETTS